MKIHASVLARANAGAAMVFWPKKTNSAMTTKRRQPSPAGIFGRALAAAVSFGSLGLWPLAAATARPDKGPTDTYAINPANGIQEEGYVVIGGIKQWIQIRGDDRKNPVLLFIHGGPGASALARGSLWHSWERTFTVVQWDQRGAGRTYRENGETESGQMTIPRMTQDGIEVAQYLVTHLQKKKIILLGASWGSLLSIRMIHERPDLFFAYVGTGQLVDYPGSLKFNRARSTLERARAAHNDEAVTELERLGPTDDGAVDKWASKLADVPGEFGDILPQSGIPPGITANDLAAIPRGMKFSHAVLEPQYATVNFLKEELTFALPMFFFQGTEDATTPIELVEQYFKAIQAPHKELVRFAGDHHFAQFARPEKFLQELARCVRPLATAPER